MSEEIRLPGTGKVTSADTAQVDGREVTALYEAHALSFVRLAHVMLLPGLQRPDSQEQMPVFLSNERGRLGGFPGQFTGVTVVMAGSGPQYHPAAVQYACP